jgi:hypothetical protein
MAAISAKRSLRPSPPQRTSITAFRSLIQLLLLPDAVTSCGQPEGQVCKFECDAETNNPPHRSDIEKLSIAGESLAIHRVRPACNANRSALRAGGARVVRCVAATSRFPSLLNLRDRPGRRAHGLGVAIPRACKPSSCSVKVSRNHLYRTDIVNSPGNGAVFFRVLGQMDHAEEVVDRPSQPVRRAFSTPSRYVLEQILPPQPGLSFSFAPRKSGRKCASSSALTISPASGLGPRYVRTLRACRGRHRG